MKEILVTGGAGYIGSHTCIELIESGYQPIVLDNLSNSSEEAIRRVEQITQHSIPFYKGDIRDTALLETILNQHKIQATIHFAGLKAVGESVEQPLKYYNNNVAGSVTLLETLQKSNIKHFVFSSSATVYGDPETVPIKETDPAGATTNPYGRSKWMIEEILRDLYTADSSWHIAILRYFNPVGAHASGLIGEDPNGIPNNLMPYIAQTAIGKRPHLNIFGNNYPTQDGTGVRDFIHVVDLAKGHIKALEYLFSKEEGELLTVNLGTGKGTSVLELVQTFEQASGKTIAYQFVERRAGDIATCYADPSLAKQKLNWQTEKDIQTMCQDTWRWQTQNPNDYS